MSAKETPPPPPSSGDAPKKKGKLLIVIGAAVFLLVALGAGAYVLLKPAPEESEEATVEEKPKKKKKDDKSHAAVPAYMPLEPFVVNLTSEAGEQFLQLAVTLEFEDLKEAEHTKAFSPKIRNQIMLLLSGKKPSELMPKEGKEKLAADIRDEINIILGGYDKNKKAPEVPVTAVLFTSFIIQ